MTTLLILVCVIIAGSAVLSMIEAAILSLPLIRARILHEENRRNSATLLYIKSNIHITVASIVIINNAINISGSIFIGQQVTRLFGEYWLAIAAVVLTFAIIVFGEVIPKTIGERYKVPISLFFARPLNFLVWVFTPMVKLILQMERPLTKRYNLPMPKVTEEEIKLMLKLGRDAGTVEMDEELLCNRVFRLNDLRALQMMKPLDQIYALPAGKKLGEVKEAIISSPFSRIAVYEKDPKDFVGIVQHRILLREIAKDNYDAYVREFMHKAIYVPQMAKADALLEKFQAYNQHLFIVQDDMGRDVGLITMEDVLEELFGEIYDEKDVRPPQSPPAAARGV